MEEPLDDEVEVNGFTVELREGSEDYERITELRGLVWEEQEWQASGAWLCNTPNGVQRVKGTQDVPLADTSLSELGWEEGTELQFVENGWSVDHCEVCGTDLYECDDPLVSRGWRSGQIWVCDDCYRLFVAPDATMSGKFPVVDVGISQAG